MKRALVLLLAAPSGCWIPAYTIASNSSDWVEIPNVAKPPEEVVRLAREVLSRQGYTLLPQTAGELGFESDWDVHLSSHWRDGFRTKVEVRVEAAGAPGRSRVRIRDRREFNDEAKNPMNPAAAAWMGATVDDKHNRKLGEPAMRVRQLLKLKLEGQP
jgi:hypothetical protein